VDSLIEGNEKGGKVLGRGLGRVQISAWYRRGEGSGSGCGGISFLGVDDNWRDQIMEITERRGDLGR